MINRSKLYDLIYAKADKLLKEHNPCKIHKNKKGKTVCIHYTGNQYERLCCDFCCQDYNERIKRPKTYWSKNGCTIKCLRCKLHLCSSISIHKKNAELTKKFRKFSSICRRYNIPLYYYTTKKQAFIMLKQLKQEKLQCIYR
jgi:hypothetical protein